jgi:uncharacterized membrane protein YbhN (UPF0104 family)
MKKQNNILLVLRVIGITLGSGFLAYQIFIAVRDFDWSILSPNASKNLLLALCLSIIGVMLQMIAWKVILQGAGQEISLIKVFSGFNLSFIARYIPGTVWGYLTRGEWLKREHEVPYAMTNYSSVIETIGLVSANLLIFFQGMILDKLVYFIILFIILITVGSWAFINFLVLWKPTRRLFRFETHKIIKFSFTKWIIIFALSILLWYCYGLTLTIFANSINSSITFSDTIKMSALYALAWLIGFIVPFLPSGLGLRDYSLAILLLAQFGVERVDATFIAIGFRLIISMAEIFWILFGLINKSVRRINKLRQSNNLDG